MDIGPYAGASAPLTILVSFPPGTANVTFFIYRPPTGLTQGATVDFTITDSCGTWQSFAGGGTAAFGP